MSENQKCLNLIRAGGSAIFKNVRNSKKSEISGVEGGSSLFRNFSQIFPFFYDGSPKPNLPPHHHANNFRLKDAVRLMISRGGGARHSQTLPGKPHHDKILCLFKSFSSVLQFYKTVVVNRRITRWTRSGTSMGTSTCSSSGERARPQV